VRVMLSIVVAACLSGAVCAQTPSASNASSLSCLSQAQRAEAESKAKVLFDEYARKKQITRAVSGQAIREDRMKKREAMFDCDAQARKEGLSPGERCQAEIAAFREAQRALDSMAESTARAIKDIEAEEAAQMQQLRSQYPSC